MTKSAVGVGKLLRMMIVKKWFVLTTVTASMMLPSMMAGAEKASQVAPAANKSELGIRCRINGQEVSFGETCQAVPTEEGGVLLVGYRGPATLMIQTPKLHPGTQHLKNTPKLRLNYSRAMYSSNSKDHYAASSGTPQSELRVKLVQPDKKTRIIEGTFSAVAVSSPAGEARITEGEFRLELSKQ